MSLTRDQLRAARALLNLNQVELADLADVAAITVRRYESGYKVDDLTIAKMRQAVERAGALLIDVGATFDGRPTGGGVALSPEADLPSLTRERIANADNCNGLPRRPADPNAPPRPRGRPRKGGA